MKSRMVTRSKSFGWSRVVEGICLLLAVSFFSGCGLEEKGPPPGSVWTAKYQAFGGTQPADQVALRWKDFLDRPVLVNVKISAPSVMTAFTELNREIRASGAQAGLAIVQIEPTHESYQTPIEVDLEFPTVAGVIDEIAGQAEGLVWDFREEQLVIRPRN